MAVQLEGGCRVTVMNEGSSQNLDSLKVWNHIGPDTGAKDISLRILEFGPGVSPGLSNRDTDEVLYFLESQDELSADRCSVSINGERHELTSQTGIYLAPGQTMIVDNPGAGSLFFVSAQSPSSATDVARISTRPFVHLTDRAAIPTADRWYRVLVDEEVGSEQVTQFVGSIPPGRAPDHFHHYEEVLFILRGVGRMWAGETNTGIGPGSCIYLPKGQVHCVENTGTGELRLLGVFYPAGSPAVRYEGSQI
jgi:mannose-6-phosphate isomerase-like protein (cupin superfamily)